MALGTPTTNAFVASVFSNHLTPRITPTPRTLVSITFALIMAKLNINVVRNLFARRQLMNASFDKLRLCSTYGAFGTVAETREELIIESANDINGPWREYQFKVKPGDITRRPSWISPYHHRLDWQMWIASQVGRIERSAWIYSLLLKLLKQEPDVVRLLECDPWESASERDMSLQEQRPKYIRIEKYLYKFYNKVDDTNASGDGKRHYWTRERLGRYFPRQGVMTADMLEELV